MERVDKIKLLMNIKTATHEVVASIFDEIDLEILKHSQLIDGVKYNKTSETRLYVRNLRAEVLDRLNALGSGYELQKML